MSTILIGVVSDTSVPRALHQVADGEAAGLIVVGSTGRSEHVGLLVCGSRGYGPLRSVLLGGVSRGLVDGAHCPVLVLPRGTVRPLEDLMREQGAIAAR